MEIIGHLRNDDWGKVGHRSIVAKYYSNIEKNWWVDLNLPYAELWLGCHPNGEARLRSSRQPLSKYINEHPEALDTSRKRFKNTLSFVVKVLSIKKPLSIQAHPSEEAARDLHSKHPQRYRDPNEKNVLTIALSPAELLCGFRPVTEIKRYLKHIKELSILIPSEIIEEYRKTESQDALKLCFRHLLFATELETRKAAEILFSRLKNSDDEVKDKYLFKMIEKIHRDFPYDVGIFTPYFLNYMPLNPGDGCFIAAKVIHMYLSGDTINFESCSDNVSRGSVTTKVKDPEALLEVIDYKSTILEDILYKATEKVTKYQRVYMTPVPDFVASRYSVPSGESFTLESLEVGSIFLVTDGRLAVGPTQIFETGTSIFLPAKHTFTFEARDRVTIYRGYRNVSYGTK